MMMGLSSLSSQWWFFSWPTCLVSVVDVDGELAGDLFECMVLGLVVGGEETGGLLEESCVTFVMGLGVIRD